MDGDAVGTVIKSARARDGRKTRSRINGLDLGQSRKGRALDGGNGIGQDHDLGDLVGVLAPGEILCSLAADGASGKATQHQSAVFNGPLIAGVLFIPMKFAVIVLGIAVGQTVGQILAIEGGSRVGVVSFSQRRKGKCGQGCQNRQHCQCQSKNSFHNAFLSFSSTAVTVEKWMPPSPKLCVFDGKNLKNKTALPLHYITKSRVFQGFFKKTPYFV